jgi:hypothetical protein
LELWVKRAVLVLSAAESSVEVLSVLEKPAKYQKPNWLVGRKVGLLTDRVGALKDHSPPRAEVGGGERRWRQSGVIPAHPTPGLEGGDFAIQYRRARDTTFEVNICNRRAVGIGDVGGVPPDGVGQRISSRGGHPPGDDAANVLTCRTVGCVVVPIGRLIAREVAVGIDNPLTGNRQRIGQLLPRPGGHGKPRPNRCGCHKQKNC